MLTDDPWIGRSAGRIDLMVHQQSELPACALKRTQPVWNSDHAITVDLVAYRQNRNEFNSRHARNQVRLGGCARTDVRCGRRLPRQQKRRGTDQQWRRRQRALQKASPP